MRAFVGEGGEVVGGEGDRGCEKKWKGCESLMRPRAGIVRALAQARGETGNQEWKPREYTGEIATTAAHGWGPRASARAECGGRARGERAGLGNAVALGQGRGEDAQANARGERQFKGGNRQTEAKSQPRRRTVGALTQARGENVEEEREGRGQGWETQEPSAKAEGRPAIETGENVRCSRAGGVGQGRGEILV